MTSGGKGRCVEGVDAMGLWWRIRGGVLVVEEEVVGCGGVGGVLVVVVVAVGRRVGLLGGLGLRLGGVGNLVGILVGSLKVVVLVVVLGVVVDVFFVVVVLLVVVVSCLSRSPSSTGGPLSGK